jgi:endonuclease G
MKSLIRLSVVCYFVFGVFFVSGQPVGVKPLKHKYYTSYFSSKLYIPVMVKYTLSREMVSCADPLGRTNRFAADPSARNITNLDNDYKGSGFDRGHNMSAADNGCDETGMEECFYFSNMTPQTHHLNAGVWKSLEEQERVYAKEQGKIYVFCGSVGRQKTIGTHKVVVPTHMWKLIYFPTLHRYESYYFPNTNTTQGPISRYRISKEVLESRVGITIHGSRFTWSLN